MSTTRSSAESAPDRATRLREAEFVRIVTRADGDGVAAAATLARAVAGTDVPFQVSAARTVAGRSDRVESARETGTDGDIVVAVGDADADADLRFDDPDRPASVDAWAVASELATPDPTLALAGAVAAGATPVVESDPAATVLAAAADRDLVERRPGVGVPTDDAVDGLAHSTLVHGPFSGDPDAVSETFGGMLGGDDGDPERRRLASALALSVVGHPDASERSGTAIERALRPHAIDGPFATVEGYADVLDAVAREAPGTAIALALGHGARDRALSAWRDHARRTHRAVRAATTARYDGLLAVRVDEGPVETVARLVGWFRSPEPVTLVVADGTAAATAADDTDLAAAMRATAAAADGEYDAVGDRGYARLDGDAAAAITAFREAVE